MMTGDEHRRRIVDERLGSRDVKVVFSVRSRRLFEKLRNAWLQSFPEKPHFGDKRFNQHHAAVADDIARFAGTTPVELQETMLCLLRIQQAILEDGSSAAKAILEDIGWDLHDNTRALLVRVPGRTR